MRARGRPGRVYIAEAIVLRRLTIGETDRVVTLFTRELGKLNAIAKGAGGPRSKLAGATEPFTRLTALLARGQNLDVLTQAEVRNAFPRIRKDLTRIGYASHFLEIADAGVEERQPAPELWDLLAAALDALEGARTPDVLARAFEVRAAGLLGYAPRLEACVLDGLPVDEDGGFHPLRGGLLCARCARATPGTVAIGPGTLAALRELPAQSLARAANSTWDRATRTELARCLVPYIRHHLETPMKALQFLEGVASPE